MAERWRGRQAVSNVMALGWAIYYIYCWAGAVGRGYYLVLGECCWYKQYIVKE